MVHYTRFQDIPPLTPPGAWECDFSLERALRFVEEEKIDLNPDFQRAHVWTEEQQVAWLEFFLRGGKTGRVIYFNNPSWQTLRHSTYDDRVIVDGKQRLEAVRRFLANEIRVFGSYHQEYTDRPRRSLITLRLNVNTLQSKAAVLQWYLQFNSGGTQHTEPELQSVRDLLALEERKDLMFVICDPATSEKLFPSFVTRHPDRRWVWTNALSAAHRFSTSEAAAQVVRKHFADRTDELTISPVQR